MITMLSNIGRTVVSIAALVIIGANTLGGYLIAVGLSTYPTGLVDLTAPGQALPMTGLDVFGALCGFIVGLFMAGMLLGLVATVYDMRDNLRVLAGGTAPSPSATTGERREPHLRAVRT